MKDIRIDGKLNCKITDVGYISVVRNNGFSFSFKQGKPKYTFLYLESGKIVYNFEKEGKITVEAGQLLYIPRFFPYDATYIKDGTTTKTIVFSAEDDYFLGNDKPFVKKRSEISSVFDSITDHTMHNTVFLFAKAYELIYLLQNETASIPNKYKNLIPAIEEMNNRYFENHKMCHYAKLCNMSESNFRKLFKEYTGKTPIEYRNLIRIAEVAKMLESGEFTVAEAAYSAGFNNMSFFYQVYNGYSKNNKTYRT